MGARGQRHAEFVYKRQPCRTRLNRDEQFSCIRQALRALTAVSALSLAALVYGYRWWAAPPVMTDDGYGRSPHTLRRDRAGRCAECGGQAP